MNIFVTSPDPAESAKFLDDKRVIKMILESAQMLCTALNHYNYLEVYDAWDIKTRRLRKYYYFPGTTVLAYRPTHPNHPCNVWVRTGRTNYFWLYNHFIALCKEYTHRYGKMHKSTYLSPYLVQGMFAVPEKHPHGTPFVNCAAHSGLGISYKHIEDVHMAYKLYLNDRWDTDKREPTWTKRETA